jgi:hypothetical protein
MYLRILVWRVDAAGGPEQKVRCWLNVQQQEFSKRMIDLGRVYLSVKHTSTLDEFVIAMMIDCALFLAYYMLLRHLTFNRLRVSQLVNYDLD